jgi:hypothetical protein
MTCRQGGRAWLLIGFCFVLVLASGPSSAEAQNGENEQQEKPEKKEADTAKMAARKSATFTPHLKSGKLGVHPDVGEGEKRVWPHKLPFLGQKVTDLGFDLPIPYGVALVGVWMKQDVSLSDLRVKLSNSPAPAVQVPFVTIGTSNAETLTAEGKFDFWLFPFLNVFAFAGHIDGEAFVPITVPGEDTLKAVAPPIGALCDNPPGSPLRPDLCDQDFVILDNSKYQGTNLGVGATLAGGFGKWFVAIPLSYAASDLSNTTDFVRAFEGSLRFGFHAPYREDGMFAVYLGATYLDTEQDITGTVSGGGISIDYTIHQKALEPWNYLAGFNWTITPKWWLQAEVGFGGTRQNVIASMTYRF